MGNKQGATIGFSFLLNSVAFNVCTLNQIGQQSTPARSRETLKTDVYTVSKMLPRDSTSTFTPHGPDTISFSGFAGHTSGDRVSSSGGQHGSRIVVGVIAKSAPLDLIPNNSLMYISY